MDIKKILSDSGYKLTQPRLKVLEYLEKAKGLISARDLYQKIKTVDQVSVYRVLNLFEELHLVQSEIIEKEKLYCLADHPHHHIICRKCGYTEEFKCSKKEFKNFKNFTDVHHHLTLIGVCHKCCN